MRGKGAMQVLPSALSPLSLVPKLFGTAHDSFVTYRVELDVTIALTSTF